MSAPVGPRMQKAAGLQSLKLQIVVASPDLQTRTFPGTQVSRKIRSPEVDRASEPQRLGSCASAQLQLRFVFAATAVL